MKRTLYHVTTLLFPKNAPSHEERRVFRKLSQLKQFLNSTQYHLVGIFKEVIHHRYYYARIKVPEAEISHYLGGA